MKPTPGLEPLPEVNIRKDGSLDISEEALGELDVVGIAVHSHFKLSKDKMTERLIEEMTQLEELEADRKNYLDESRGKISDQEATISRLHHMIRDGFETSDREVRIVRDFDSGYRKIYDVKTGKFVGTEPLTAHDRQVDMDDALEENARREEDALASNGEEPDTDAPDHEDPSDGS